MNLLIAVLEKRAGYFFGNLDVYINIVSGITLRDTACDLAAVSYTHLMSARRLAVSEVTPSCRTGAAALPPESPAVGASATTSSFMVFQLPQLEMCIRDRL